MQKKSLWDEPGIYFIWKVLKCGNHSYNQTAHPLVARRSETLPGPSSSSSEQRLYLYTTFYHNKSGLLRNRLYLTTIYHIYLIVHNKSIREIYVIISFLCFMPGNYMQRRSLLVCMTIAFVVVV